MTNTREVRYRKKLEEEYTELVDHAMKNDPNFRPPVEYQQQKRSHRPSDAHLPNNLKFNQRQDDPTLFPLSLSS